MNFWNFIKLKYDKQSTKICPSAEGVKLIVIDTRTHTHKHVTSVVSFLHRAVSANLLGPEFPSPFGHWLMSIRSKSISMTAIAVRVGNSMWRNCVWRGCRSAVGGWGVETLVIDKAPHTHKHTRNSYFRNPSLFYFDYFQRPQRRLAELLRVFLYLIM